MTSETLHFYLRHVNHLAHIYLSGDDPELMMGNFIADFVKGKHFEDYPQSVKRGILMHRAIDSFTDAHPTFRKSTQRVRPILRKFSGMAVDVYYDHFLANSWQDRHQMDLGLFTTNVYGFLMQHLHEMPTGSVRFFKYMTANRILEGYARMDVLRDVFMGMSRRTTFESKLELAADCLRENYEYLRSDFEAFFPELEDHCRMWLLEHPA